MTVDEYALTLPPGSSRINIVMSGASVPLPRDFDKLFGNDIALNIAFMLELDTDDADALVLYIDVAGVSGCVSGTANRRRLLSVVSGGPLVVSAYVLGNVTIAIPSLANAFNHTNSTDTVQQITNMLERRIVAGNFSTTAVQVNITGMTSEKISNGITTEDISTSSFNWTSGRIAGVVIGCVVGFGLILAALLYVLGRNRSASNDEKKSTTELPIYWTGKYGVAPISV